MKPPSPFEGSLLADGLLIGRALAREAFALRVLEVTRANGRVLAVGEDALVIFGAPTRMRAELAGGTPLVRRGEALVGFVTEAPEAERALVRLVAGAVQRTPLAGLSDLPASALLETAGLRIHTMRPLGPPPAAIVVPREPSKTVRSVFGVPENGAVTDLFARTPKNALARAGRGSFLDGVFGVLARLIRAFTRPAPARAPARAPAPLPAPSKALAPRKETALDRFLERMRRRLAFFERLSGRQARYLSELLDELEGGNVERAVRHAIPLGSGKEEGEPRIALGVPSMRTELRIDLGRPGPGSVMPIADEVQAALRAGYERAFQALDARGAHKDAAFVLAELLRDHARAVDYLEKHEEFLLAAQIAEARDLPAERVIALYMLAGEHARAVASARRASAHMSAIVYLEQRKRMDAAAVLRLELAERLEAQGKLVAAADVLLPVPAARHLAIGLLRRAVTEEGMLAARAWPKHIVEGGATEDEIETLLVPALLDESEDGASFRKTFAETQLALPQPAHKDARTPIKLAYRGLLTDRHAYGLAVNVTLARLPALVEDPVLTADLPMLSSVPTARASIAARVSALDVGSFDVRDAVALPSGRTLVALGELGVRILGRDGAVETHFAQPANALVVDHTGERALAVMPRGGETARLARIDLVRRRAAPWIDVPCDLVAGEFDGERLFLARVSRGTSSVLCLDALADDVQVLYAVTGLEGEVHDVCVTPHMLRVLVGAPRGEPLPFPDELMSFELPSRVLRAKRIATPKDAMAGFGNAIRPFGSAASSHLCIDERVLRVLHVDGDAVRQGVYTSSKPDPELLTVATLEGAERIRMRAQGELVTLSDDRGRVLVLDRQSLACVRVLRA